MLSEIDKDARAIAALQKEVLELREQCVSNVRCIVALEEETRLLKAQQTKDYTQIMILGTHQTETFSEQERSLATLQKDVRGVQEQTLRLTALDKDTRARLERMVLPAFEPVVINAVTGEKVRLPPLEGCPNVFVLQAEGVRVTGEYSTHPMMKNTFYMERPCWIISIQHVDAVSEQNFIADQAIEHRLTVRTFLSEHTKSVNADDIALLRQVGRVNDFTPCVSKKMVLPYSIFRRPHDSHMVILGRNHSRNVIDAFQPALIEFLP